MKWVLILVAVLVGLPVLMILVGTVLPREHVAAVAIVLRQPPETVWAVVRDLGAVPQWWPGLRSSERVTGPDGRERWRQVSGGGAMTIVVEEGQPPRRLVSQIEPPPGAPFGGAWIYEIVPEGDGSRVTVTEQGWVANPLFRFLSRFVFGHYRTLESYARALGRRFNEEVTPVRQAE
jgi:uncharacterized protein YndB with AHSA1/START domain